MISCSAPWVVITLATMLKGLKQVGTLPRSSDVLCSEFSHRQSNVGRGTVTWGTSVYRSHFTETVNIAAAALNGRNYNCRRAWKKIDATKVTVSCGAWCNSSAAVVAWLYTVLMRRLRLALLRWSNDFPRRIGLSARNSKITTRKSANWRRCSKLCLFFSPNVGLHYAEKM